jgi:hypothetical protein
MHECLDALLRRNPLFVKESGKLLQALVVFALLHRVLTQQLQVMSPAQHARGYKYANAAQMSPLQTIIGIT